MKLLPNLVNRHLKLLLPLFLMLFVQTVTAQTLRAGHDQLRAALDKGDTATAETQLQTLRRAVAPPLFAANNYDYLAGRLALQRGDTATAAACFQTVVARNSPLAQYALWHLAETARMTGNLPAERNYLRQFLALAPASRLRPAVFTRLSQSYFQSQDYAGVIALLKPLAANPKDAETRAARALLGQAYLGAQQVSEARQIFNDLLNNLPNAAQPDDYALSAARALDKLDGTANPAPANSTATPAANPAATPASNNAAATPQLAETDRLRRAQVYHFNRDWPAARRHWLALVNDFPQSVVRGTALFQIARSLGQEGQYEQALPYYQRVMNEYAGQGVARDAASFYAAALVRVGQIDNAVAAYQKFIADNPDADNPERSYLNIIDALRDANRDAEALQWTARTRQDLAGEIGAALALFAQAKIHVAQNNWAEVIKDCDALNTLPDLGGTRYAGATNKTEVAFWRAFALEQQGKIAEAADGYLALPEGRNEYYGQRATQRLQALAAQEKYRNIFASRAESLYSTAVKAIEYKYFDEGRKAAQSALRLTTDEGVRDSLRDLLRRAYAGLPAYSRVTLPKLLPVGRTQIYGDNNTPAPDLATQTAPTAATLADELLFLGLYDEGAPELAAAGTLPVPAVPPAPAPTVPPVATPTPAPAKPSAAPNSGPPVPAPAGPPFSDAGFTMAVLFARGAQPNRTLIYAEPFWRTVPADYDLTLAPREMVELLYPAPFRASLLRHAPPRQVDPRFLLSIARQESRFRTEAKSVAAARGMMQFIAPTADTIAQQLQLKDFRQDDLYDPDVAVLFGAQYLKNLFDLFPGQPQAVAGSYNGGEDNLARWLKRSRSNDPDRYTAEVNFSQSKDYIYRVLANYAVYQTFYDEKLNPIAP